MNYGILNIDQPLRKMRAFPNSSEAAAVKMDILIHGVCPKLVFILDESLSVNRAIFKHLLSEKKISRFAIDNCIII